MNNYHELNEADTRYHLIDPALKEAGWGVVDGSSVRLEVVAPGRLVGGGRRAKKDIADYVLIHRNQKLAVIEAKRASARDTAGLAQAKEYATKLQARFAYSTNGRTLYRADMQSGHEGPVDRYPTPAELYDEIYNQSAAVERMWRTRFEAVPFEDKGGYWQPRYYQHNAITNALDALAGGQDRILLTLATGTGKTAIAFQLAWKLFHSRWNLADWRASLADGTSAARTARQPRILFLADRNFLADQAFNAFSAFPEDALVRIAPDAIRKRGRAPKNGSIFFTIFQTFMTSRTMDGEMEDDAGSESGYEVENEDVIEAELAAGDGERGYTFGDYPPDFFDLIIIDECHRGGANSESTWRGILDYFAPAVQLGLTATPKRTINTDTYAYFGEPVYVYSLKEGINDGYLTPFKVKQIQTTLDDYIYTGDDRVIEGEIQSGRRYAEQDFNRIIEISPRERKRVEIFMQEIDQREKTLVFCATQNHALAVRDLINQLKTSRDPDYCVRVTADDGERGETHLRTFQDNEKSVPTVLTTSQKLSTGVDARNVRNIVLMRPVNSMIEFKQIIGRGTRLFEGKDYFTIYDFVKAYEHFSDPEWDGEPQEPERVEWDGEDQPRRTVEAPASYDPVGEPDDESVGRQLIRIELADGKARTIQHMMTTSFWNPDGTPLSAIEFIERLFGELPELVKDEAELVRLWSQPNTRRHLLDGLAERGYGAEQLSELSRIVDAEQSDLFDVLAYIAFAQPPISRQDRVRSTKDKIYAQYTDDAQQEFLNFVLDHYVRQGVGELDEEKLRPLIELKYHSISDAVSSLGGVPEIRNLFIGFQKHLYAEERAAA